MKILHAFVVFSPYGGGTVDLLYKLSKALTQRGHKLTIYAGDWGWEQEYADSLPEVKVHPFHVISNFKGLYLTTGMAREAKNHLREYDIVHLHCMRSHQNIILHRYAKRYGIPYILDTHGSLPRKVVGEKGLRWFFRWLFDIAFGNRILRDSIKVVAQNNFIVREYNKFGVNDEKIASIPLFFPLEDFSDIPEQNKFRRWYGIEEQKILMFLGRINRIKGLDFLVKSFHELSQSRQDIILVIAGNDDGYKSELERLIVRLNLSEKVLFTGFLAGQDKLAALVDADIVIQPSKYEQAAWAPIEAILCNTPIIVSAGSGSGEDVTRMNAGYLVEYGNKSQMVQTIQIILDNPEEPHKKVRQAQEYIKNNLSLNQKVEEYENLYRECIAENKATWRKV